MNDIKNNSEEIKSHKPSQPLSPNLFQGRTEGEKGNVKFPNWDIIPPNQIINPRIKN
ncbi:hypothetical protein [Chryseobacterium oranimense]|uniref:hypothetical protein n=1 Tax=Chryseobacterium oranimense TaxID=421058 RepID=UPI002235C1DB|nr:hypothetical protein [Chryseobacterium oranimense]